MAFGYNTPYGYYQPPMMDNLAQMTRATPFRTALATLSTTLTATARQFSTSS